MGTDNSDVNAKLAVRRWVLRQADKPYSVLDLYCGRSGEMYRGVWHEAEVYLGVDVHEPHKLAATMKLSAERAVQELDLGKYNVFDVDVYSSPWVVARRVLRKRKGSRYGISLTWGGERGLRNGYANEIVRRSTGCSGLSDYRLLCRYRDLVTLLLLRSLGEMPGVHLTSAVKAEAGRHITYIGIVVDSTVTTPFCGVGT